VTLIFSNIDRDAENLQQAHQVASERALKRQGCPMSRKVGNYWAPSSIEEGLLEVNFEAKQTGNFL
jgi:hypothetical protein